jgi:succinoglycan biosynthesis transport protein ExoP
LDPNLTPKSNDSLSVVDAPRYPFGAPTLAYVHSDPEPPGLLVQYAQTITRWRWKILGFAVIGGIVGLLLALPKTPLYRAHTSLDIQGLNGNFMNLRNADPNDATQSYSADVYIQTQIKLLQSDSLSARVIRKLSDVGGRPLDARPDLLTVWRHQLGLPLPLPLSRKQLLDLTAKSLKVKPLGLTRLVEATCDSSDPQMAADFCNTLADEFMVQDLEIRSDAATKTGEWLTRQLADMRGKLEKNEQRLQSYTQANTLFYNQSSESVPQVKLRMLQTQLAEAQADRMAKEAQRGLLQSGNLDSLPIVLDNAPLKMYEAKLSELQRQYAELNTTLTTDAPKLQKLQSQIDLVERDVTRARTNVLGRVKSEYETALHREQLLSAAFNAQEKIVSTQAEKTTEYQMLRREVESGRQIYETMLQRVKEAGLISVLRASPVRVVDQAKPANAPFEPNPFTNALEGLLGGAFFGIAFVSVTDRIKRRLRAPGELRTHLHVRELGIIPSSRVDSMVRSKSQPLELVTFDNERSLLAECFRATMNSLLDGRSADAGPRILVISSPNSRDGKTTLTCNLGIAFAETGRRVIVVDADLRRPRLQRVFDKKNDWGLSDLLAGDSKLADCESSACSEPTKVPGLSVLTAGTTSRSISSLLHSRRMKELLDRLRKDFDTILIDTPPMLHLADARVIARLAEGVVLVLHSGVDADEAEYCSRMLGEVGTPVIGVVLNNFNPTREAPMRQYKTYYTSAESQVSKQ